MPRSQAGRLGETGERGAQVPDSLEMSLLPVALELALFGWAQHVTHLQGEIQVRQHARQRVMHDTHLLDDHLQFFTTHMVTPSCSIRLLTPIVVLLIVVQKRGECIRIIGLCSLLSFFTPWHERQGPLARVVYEGASAIRAILCAKAPL